MDLTKLHLGLRTAVCALALAVAVPASFAQRPHSTAADSPEWNVAAKERILDQMSKLIKNQAYVPSVDFSKWDEELGKIKQDAEKATNEDQFAGIVNSGLRTAFNISHIVLLPPRAVENRVTQKMVGIGIRINVVPEGVLVTSTVPGAPADKAGIEPGDVIMEADGHHVDGPTYIAGPEGTSVNLKVKKADASVKTYKVMRASFSTKQKEELKEIDKDTAAIRIYTFDLSYDRDNVETLMKQAAKYKNLLVDLRGNGGGAVGNMMHFLATLLPQGTPVGTFVNKKMVDDFVNDKKGSKNDLAAIAQYSPSKLRVGFNRIPIFKGRIAVLVNAGSGSASEITAQALKELGSPVVGKKSAGAVLVSVMGDLPNNFNLQFPISDYVSYKGVRLEANGIIPDAEVNDVAFLKKDQVDPAYTAAETLLNKIAKSGQ